MKRIIISNIELFSEAQKAVLKDYIIRTGEYSENQICDELITRVYALLKYYEELDSVFENDPLETLKFTENEKELISEFMNKPKGQKATYYELLDVLTNLIESHDLHCLFESSFDSDTHFPF